jgi:hypothetical protein
MDAKQLAPGMRALRVERHPRHLGFLDVDVVITRGLAAQRAPAHLDQLTPVRCSPVRTLGRLQAPCPVELRYCLF